MIFLKHFQVVTEFSSEHGREPTEEELKPIFERLNQALSSRADKPDIDEAQDSKTTLSEEPVKRPASIGDIPAVAKKAKADEHVIVS